ncbi:AsmA-like C-terminal region-containing protein [Granulicella arctica]|uniref:AsmA-like C-terminal region-containing protein n=1 Tax=Granulicella arctica TaxID=940613 RepID=UPI0032B2A486
MSPNKKPWWRSRWFIIPSITILILLSGAVIALAWVARHAEPLLRARVIETLSTRFHSPVQLDELHISFLNGLEVQGSGLRILYLAGPTKPDARLNAPPMLSIHSFQFRTGWHQIFEPSLRVVTVQVQGAELHIPPKKERGPLMPDNPKRRGQPREGILVDKLLFTDFKIVIETTNPSKPPLVFNIANLTLTDVGLKQPFTYDATLSNPKPIGDVRSVGHFGPWQDDNPRDTPLDGSYIFSHADLSTIKGIGGILSSNGTFYGTLSHIVADGITDTPDFRLSTSTHTLPLHTDFHAIVDATNGDTTLQPVHARLAHSFITATGSILRQRGVPGHDTELDIVIDQGRIDDFLTLGVRTWPPVLRGTLAARAHIGIPPGPMPVNHRMRLQGSFSIEQATFSNPRLQQQIDDLSERAQGWPEKANAQQAVAITSSMKGSFLLENEQMNVPDMVFEMPGATVNVNGQYGLDGATMDFHGAVRTQATASQMIGGWKQLLVMPFDHLLKKNGAGMEVPFKLGGTQKDPKLALDFAHKNTPAVKQ